MATKKEAETVEQSVSMAEVKEQIAAMLAEAKQEAKRIVEEAQKATGSKPVDAERAARLEEARKRGEELVEIELFKDSGKYKDDVFVAVNGENCVIKRGERVKVKRKFADALERSQRMDRETAQLIERKSSEWAKASEKL